MQITLPSKISADLVADPALAQRVGRGRKYRVVGWLGAVSGSALLVAERYLPNLARELPPTLVGIASALLAISVLLINWTRIWVRESREPFKYTYSVGEFEPGPEIATEGPAALAAGPIRWLTRDLTEKLGTRVSRLSLRDEDEVPPDDPEGEPAPHVYISGWYGLRGGDGSPWCLEVVPRVRVGGKGAPAELGRTVRFNLVDRNRPDETAGPLPPPLDAQQYRLLLERVYWAVASKIYAQIRQRVEEKALLLPPGHLRAAAYLYEADDYARSNTLEAFDAARDLYRMAHQAYDRTAYRHPETAWRRIGMSMLASVQSFRGWIRRRLCKLVRRGGRREVLAAKAQLGFARMLVAEWNLRFLCGSIPKEIYEAPPNLREAIARLERLPADIPERDQALFRAHVTLALAQSDLRNPAAAVKSLQRAAELQPANAAEDSDFLLAEAIVAGDPIRALRLLTRAVERDPAHERAHFLRAELLERLWRRREQLEPQLAEALDKEYEEVIAIDPGNVSAWANRGYIGWLLSNSDPEEEESGGDGRPSWRKRALEALEAGRRYKDVRRDAMVAELNWNLVRFEAEAGDFLPAYEHYIDAVSAMLSEPRMGFFEYFYGNANRALRKRYIAYEERVSALVAARPEERMANAVLAFVLNDCGGCWHAFHRRSGSSHAGHRAARLFQRSIGLNSAFVLPKFNLASLLGEEALDARLPAQDRATLLNSALGLLAEVIEVERFWTFPRLRMARLERLLPSVREQFAVGSAMEAESHAWLQVLLPHRYLRSNGRPGGALDGKGAHVGRLLGDRGIKWTTEFNEAQARVLLQWAELLVDQAPEEALAITKKLQESFYETDPSLLDARLKAIHSLWPYGSPKERAAWMDEIESCRSGQAASYLKDLREDPIHYAAIRSSFRHLNVEQRREILARAKGTTTDKRVLDLLTNLSEKSWWA